MASTKEEDTKAEAAQRRDAALRRAFQMPHKPHEPLEKSAKKTRKPRKTS